MKSFKYIIFIGVLFITTSVTAQEIVWFNADWAIVPKKEAVYYRLKPQPTKGGYLLIDYYMSGKKKREGVSTVYYPNEEHYVGVVKTYFETGELHTKVRYKDGLKDGPWKEFYKSGKIKERGKYNEGEKVGIWKTFYKNVYK